MKSTESTKAAKPIRGKGFPRDSPLTPHNNGRWCKKVNGRLHYFGRWEDHQGALREWLAQKDDLLAGRDPKSSTDGLTIGDVGAAAGLVNRFLTAKWEAITSGELSPRSWQDYKATCERVQRVFGRGKLVSALTSDDFMRLRRDMAKTLGPVALGNAMTRARTLFNFAFAEELIERPVKFGTAFKRPSKKVLKAHRQEQQRKHGKRMFEAGQLRALIAVANVQLKAMLLLGINCGFGNSDCGMLPKAALDLELGWVDFPRPKTAEERRCPLWPETIAAIRAALANRPTPKSEADEELVFITKRGLAWSKTRNCGTLMRDGIRSANPLSAEVAKLLREIEMKRPGLNFYALRHTFETVGGDSRDQVAVDRIMGHADGSMAAAYREGIDDARLRAVAEHVRCWLLTADRGADEKMPEGGWRLA